MTRTTRTTRTTRNDHANRPNRRFRRSAALAAALAVALFSAPGTAQSIGAGLPDQDDGATLGAAVGSAAGHGSVPNRLVQPPGPGQQTADFVNRLPNRPFVPSHSPDLTPTYSPN